MEIKRVSQILIGSHESDFNSKEVKVNSKFSRGVADAIDSFQNRSTDGTSNTMTSGKSASSSNADVSRYRQQVTTENSSSKNENNANQSQYGIYNSSNFSEAQKTASKTQRNFGYHPFQDHSEK